MSVSFLKTPFDITPSTTASWVDVDVSDYVSASATGAIVIIKNTALTGAGSSLDVGIRMNGSTDATFELVYSNMMYVVIGLDNDDIFEAYAENDKIQFLIAGSTEAESAFWTNALQHEMSVSTGVWEDIDISSDTGGDTAIGVYGYCAFNQNGRGVRKNGSTDDRHAAMWGAGFVIGVDGSEIYEGYADTASSPRSTYYNTGYITQNVTLDTNATELTEFADESWVMNGLANGDGGFLEFMGSSDVNFGLRAKDAPLNGQVVGDVSHGWLTSSFDVDQKVLIYGDDAPGYVGIVGYTDGTPSTYIPVPHATFQLTTGVPPMPSTSSISLQTLNDEGFFASNALINGDFIIAQRGTSFDSTTTFPNDDDSYLLDRWKLYSDGDDIVDVSQETSDLPEQGRAAIKMEVATANKKFGIAQFVEGKNCAYLIGGKVSLSFKAKTSAGSSIGNIRAAVIAWSGTKDQITSDIISAWGSAGSDPTLVANCTYENAPSNLAVSDSWASYSIEDVDVDTASTKNLIVLIWVDDTDAAASDELYITEVQLEKGSTATEFQVREVGSELDMAKRYYQTAGKGTEGVSGDTTSRAMFGIVAETEMRTVATRLLLKELTGYQNGVLSGKTTSSASMPYHEASAHGAIVRISGFSGLTVGASIVISTDDWLGLEAEL